MSPAAPKEQWGWVSLVAPGLEGEVQHGHGAGLVLLLCLGHSAVRCGLGAANRELLVVVLCGQPSAGSVPAISGVVTMLSHVQCSSKGWICSSCWWRCVPHSSSLLLCASVGLS